MKRKAIDELIKWKESNIRNPILLTGAKGVGKTYLAYDFAKAFFEHIYYINFEREPLINRLFIAEDYSKTNELLTEHFNLNLEDSEATRLLILDEISYSIEALKLVNTTYLNSIFTNIIIISSNPVPDEYTSKMNYLPIYPLEFDEFLRATSNEWYIELIMTHYNTNKKIPEIVHKELLELYQLYIEIGGMPGAVNEYLNFTSMINVSEQHSILVGSYHDSIIRDNPDSDALKMNQVFDSLFLQLMKENKKFQYKLIRKGTTHSMYKEAIKKLSDINYVIKCNRISNEQLLNPSELFKQASLNNETDTNFKLYYPDTGLLYTKIKEECGSVRNMNSEEDKYGSVAHINTKKALLENCVAQSLQANQYPFAFWESDSMAKIDFILFKEEGIIPIEIFEDSNTRSKSTSIFKQKYEFPYAVKISTRNFGFSNQIKYVPFYAVFCLKYPYIN